MPLRARRRRCSALRRAILPDLVNGKAALSPQMALRIETAAGVPMVTLSRMQAWHDGHVIRRRAAEIDVKSYEPG